MTLNIYAVATILACLTGALAQAVRPGSLHPKALKGTLPREKFNYFAFLFLAVCSALPFILLSSFRYDVGTDYFFTYRPMYDQLAGGAAIDYSIRTFGRWILLIIVHWLGGGHVWFFFVTTVIIVGGFFFVIYRQSTIPVISIALFVLTEAFFISMNGVMQFVALAFVFMGFIFVEKQCFWKYAIFVLVGAFFHFSVIVFLPLYFLSKFKSNPYICTAAVLGLTLLNKPLTQLLSFIVSKTPYGHYVGSVFQIPQRFYWQRALIHALVIAAALYLFYKNKNSGKPVKPIYRFFFYIELIALYLSLNRNIIPLVDRMLWSLEISEILFIPLLITLAEKKWEKIAIAAVLIGAWAFICYFEITSGNHEVLPYRCIFFQHIAIY